MIPAYVTGLGVFLPNEPIANDEIEDVLGALTKRSTKVKKFVLRQNGIESRYYAIDPKTGETTHSNAQLTEKAVRAAAEDAGIAVEDIQCLVCGTSSADQIIPAHGSMVHGELGTHAMEVVTTAGVCCSGVSALKYAYMNVASGLVHRAVATGSELASPSLRGSHFSAEIERKLKELESEPMLAFEDEFLRWMLSDGAGAALISDTPREDGRSLRIDWIEIESFSHEAETCMYFGAVKPNNRTLRSYRVVEDPQELYGDGYMNLSQDVEVLRTQLPLTCRRGCLKAARKHDLKADEIDWILPHYSSEAFREPFHQGLVEEGFTIPRERWFTNLKWKGNTGAASIFVILEELVSSGRAQTGNRIVCMVPESARFTFFLMHMTVV